MSASGFPLDVYLALKDITDSVKEIAAGLRKIQSKMK
jgi:hypothetical protein